ncbi:homocysteine S-methyltransferase family protein [bacterium]|nr:homocysteine S-methyltransferase family protein [bacterium]
MADLLASLKDGALLTDGAMGSLLFERTGRLSEAHHVYESFNVDRPELIQGVHFDYLAAGARCLKTNTFGANQAALAAFGLEQSVAAINRGGVEVARAAIAQFQADRGGAGPYYVLAAIGPAGRPDQDGAAIETVYREQVETLVAAGPDALLLETFGSLTQLERLIDLVQPRAGSTPIIAEMTLRPSGTGPLAELDAADFIGRMRDRGIPVAGVNCCAPWDATAFIEAAARCPAVRAGEILLSAMPNGGGFQRIGNRFMTYVNPEYVGKLARRFLEQGVRLIGGCCEMHPPHIREMHSYLHARQAGDRAARVAAVSTRSPAGPAEKRANGPFTRKLFDRQFAVSIEILPPRGTDPRVLRGKVDLVRQLAASGLADAVDVTDGSRGIPLTPPGDFIQLLREQLGWTEDPPGALELIPHFTGRDLNLMGVQSRLVGYHARRIHNVLFITGDPPKMSPTYPRSTAVFDLDSVAMIRLTQAGLNAGVDFGGNPLGKQDDPRTHFTIGTGFEPEALDPARELARLEEKIAAGADYVMTQPAFRHDPLAVLGKCRDRCRILIGVMILTSLEQAQRVAQVPGVVIPNKTMARLAAYPEVTDQAKAGREIAADQVRWVKQEGWAGLYLMSPGGGPGTLDVLRAGLA